MRRLFVVLCVLGIVTTSAIPASATIRSEERAFVRKINYSREIRGYRTLRVRSDLTEVARQHSRRMARAEDIFHNRSLGSDVTADWRELGENVGVGPSVYRLHKAFMSSAPHRANILYSRWDSVGVGVAHAGGRIYVTEIFANF